MECNWVAQNSGQRQYSQYPSARRLTNRRSLAEMRFLVMRDRFETQLLNQFAQWNIAQMRQFG